MGVSSGKGTLASMAFVPGAVEAGSVVVDT